MAASSSTNGQGSGDFMESSQNTAPQVVPSLSKSENEDENHEDVETSEPVDSELPADDAPVNSVAELAAVSEHEDIDHPMPDAPPLAAGVPGGVDETFDHPMPDAPGLDSADTNVPEDPQVAEDVVMVDAPPLDEGEE